ncbi:MAG: glycosyltransferase family 87 protein [Candidatus Dormibacteria bacterium]
MSEPRRRLIWTSPTLLVSSLAFLVVFGFVLFTPRLLPALLLAAVAVLCLAGYALAGRARRPGRIRFALLIAVVLAFLVGPQAFIIWQRPHLGPGRHLINDGVPQLEVAGNLLLHGIDPYGYDYSNTPMEDAWVQDLLDNPGWRHFPYPPLSLLEAAGGVLLLGSAFDARLLFIPALLLWSACLHLLGRDDDEGLAFMVLGVANPLYFIDFLTGNNDVVFLCWVYLAWVLLQRGRLGWSGISMGLAIAGKQTALLLVLPHLLMCWRRPATARARVSAVAGMTLTAGALILPFALWNLHAYVADTVSYFSAGGPSNYPVHGFGFGAMLLNLGVIPSRWDYYPFVLWQAAAGLPVLLAGALWVWRRPTRARFFAWTGILVLVVSFFHRAFHENYLVMGLVLVFIGGWSALQPGRQLFWERRAMPRGITRLNETPAAEPS